MLNRKPIFINSFQRGGSNILTNLLRSHPAVCSAHDLELQRSFKGNRLLEPRWRVLLKIICRDLPLRIAIGQDFFSPRLHLQRKPVPRWLRAHIDRRLYQSRFPGRHNLALQYREPFVPYTNNELENCRILLKGNNGLVFLADLFSEMYPDATFFALVRNGLALCESWTRRGIKAEQAAQTYNTIASQMLEYSRRIKNYHIFRFEDLMLKPQETLIRLYQLADLDIKDVKNICLQDKASTGTDGKRRFVAPEAEDRKLLWYSLEDFPKHFRADVNCNQISKLNNNDRERFLSLAAPTMEQLGYAVDSTAVNY